MLVAFNRFKRVHGRLGTRARKKPTADATGFQQSEANNQGRQSRQATEASTEASSQSRQLEPTVKAINQAQPKPVKRYEHLTGWESGYFMSEATAFAKATGSSRGMPSTSSAWL